MDQSPEDVVRELEAAMVKFNADVERLKAEHAGEIRRILRRLDEYKLTEIRKQMGAQTL